MHSCLPVATRNMQVPGHLECIDAQTWMHALSYLRSTQPRADALGILRCQCKSMCVTLQELPSWKILNLNQNCNYPDYPHVRKLLLGLVHPLVGLEPTCAPGRPNRQLLSERNRVWSQQNCPSLYDQLDIELLTLPQHPSHELGTFSLPHLQRWRATSAPPLYRARDDLDFYRGVDMACQFWHGHSWVITFREDNNETLRRVLEDRSQDWVSQEDERYEGIEPWSPPHWRTLMEVAARRYSGAGMLARL
jgi:hypothetical protein